MGSSQPSGPVLACLGGPAPASDDTGPAGTPALLRGAGLGAAAEGAEGHRVQWELTQVPLPPLLLNLQLHLPPETSRQPGGKDDPGPGSCSPGASVGLCHFCPAGMPSPPAGRSDLPSRRPVGIEGPLSLGSFHLQSPHTCPEEGGCSTVSRLVTWGNWTHPHEATQARNLSGGQRAALWEFPSQSPAVAAKPLRPDLMLDFWKTSEATPIQVGQTR